MIDITGEDVEDIELVYLVYHRYFANHRMAAKHYGFEDEDIMSLGIEGLLKAKRTFDSNRGIKFSSYAVPSIYNNIIQKMRNRMGTIVISSKYRKLIQLYHLEGKVGEDENGNELIVADICGSNCHIEVDALNSVILNNIFFKLDPTQRIIVKLRLQNKSQEEIANVLGIKQASVSKKLKKIRDIFLDELIL